MMRLLFILIFINFPLSAEDQFLHTPSHQQNTAEPIKFNRQELLKAIRLVTKTKTGEELTPFINELLQQDKIHLTNLQKGHYGESGEGCVIKDGKYYYEGLFIMLNNTLSLAEMASTLVHEVTHYRMIKDLVALNINFPVQVAAFEISAFATQYEFITELERLKLIDSQLMFTGDSKIVSEIMQNAFKLRNHWSEKDYEKVYNQLVNYGYSSTELNRVISQRTEKNCFGMVAANIPKKPVVLKPESIKNQYYSMTPPICING